MEYYLGIKEGNPTIYGNEWTLRALCYMESKISKIFIGIGVDSVSQGLEGG